MQRQVLTSVEALMTVGQEDCTAVGQDLFNILLSVLALHRAPDLQDKVIFLVHKLQ